MIPRLTAEESMAEAERIAVGSRLGAVENKKLSNRDLSRIVSRWNRESELGGRKQAAPQHALAGMGIGYREVKK